MLQTFLQLLKTPTSPKQIDFLVRIVSHIINSILLNNNISYYGFNN